jgi:transketolase
LILCRQNLPKIERPASFDDSQLLRGAYVVADVENPELVLIATGSEVSTALDAQKMLAAEGRRIRVVSAPCWEQFEALSPADQQLVLPSGVRRAVFEIGSTRFWKGVVGLDGLVIGFDRFGESAPWERLQKEFGFSVEQVAKQLSLHFWGSK